MSWLSTLGGAFSALGDSFGRCVSWLKVLDLNCNQSPSIDHSETLTLLFLFINPPQADTAGKISMYQLKIASRSGDPAIVSRCKLYYSISLIQKGSLRAAKKLVLEQYALTKSGELKGDDRLYKMCHGIWLKLQYSYHLRRQSRLAASERNNNVISR